MPELSAEASVFADRHFGYLTGTKPLTLLATHTAARGRAAKGWRRHERLRKSAARRQAR